MNQNLIDDERIPMADAMCMPYVSGTPELWEKIAFHKLSGSTICCYAYLIGRCKLHSGDTNAIDYHEMADTLFIKYAAVMKAIKKLTSVGLIIRYDKKHGNRYHLPDVKKIHDLTSA